MEKKVKKRKWLTYGTVILFLWFPYSNYAQSVKRQCISCYGSSVLIDNVLVGQTAGQTYATTSYNENKTAVLQGYQQPVVFNVEKINSEAMKNLNLNVYPNPATYFVTIQSEEIIESSIIQVTDLNGKLILFEQVTQLLTFDVNCTTWKNGTYIITVSDNNQNNSSHKLIINK